MLRPAVAIAGASGVAAAVRPAGAEVAGRDGALRLRPAVVIAGVVVLGLRLPDY